MICRVIFFALFCLLGIVRATTTTTEEPIEEEMRLIENEFNDEIEFHEWAQRAPIRHRHRNLRYHEDNDEDRVRVRRRQRAQFLLLVAIVQVWIAFMRLLNRNRE